MFEQTFVQAGAVARRPWTMAASLSIQTGMVGILVLLPLIYTEQLQFRKLAEIFTAPSPPPPAAPKLEPVKMQQTRATAATSQMVGAHTLRDPGTVPPKAAQIVDEAPPAVSDAPVGVVGGTGVPGGTGDAITGILGRILRDSAPPPQAPPAARETAAPAKPPRVRIGGAIQDGKILSKPTPVYPLLARQARISGVVRLEAVIGTDGRVRELKAVSGHPMLVPAAIEAVQRWLYSPTMLNGDPVEVSTVITVTFSMN